MSVSPFVPNFRDVGEAINVLGATSLMKAGFLLRGGKIDFVDDPRAILSPRTIVNLRNGADPPLGAATLHHCPAPDSVDVYSVGSGFSRNWILAVLNILADPESTPPIYIHCAAGKDRTGVVIAALLTALGIDLPLIAEEYELSTGQLHPDLLAEALDCFSSGDYFRGIDVAALRERFLRD